MNIYFKQAVFEPAVNWAIDSVGFHFSSLPFP